MARIWMLILTVLSVCTFLGCATVIVAPAPQPATLFDFSVRNDIPGVLNLINRGIHVDSPNAYGSSALMAASKRGYADLVKVLLDRGANVNGENVNLTTFPAALGGSYSAVFRGSILGGVQSFDLFAYVSATTGTPTASGSLTVVMTN